MIFPLTLIFPFLCPGCLTVCQWNGFCATCWKHISFITGPCCIICGTPFDLCGPPDMSCRRCAIHPPAFHKHRSIMYYSGLGRRMILGLKHGRDLCWVPFFVSWLTHLVEKEFSHIDLIVPVPLHWRRIAYRFFNQSALIARGLGKACQKDTSFQGLRRIKYTPSQGNRSFSQRKLNVERAFVATPGKVHGKRILLIDDVCTTGATLNACAKALRSAGAVYVGALSVAMTRGRN